MDTGVRVGRDDRARVPGTPGRGEARGTLDAARTALVDGGRFVFETRNPEARAWERWTDSAPIQLRGPDGVVVRYSRRVTRPPAGGLVEFTQTFASTPWPGPLVSRSVLRFFDASTVAALVVGAGLTVECQLGDWDGTPLRRGSPEIITVACRGPVG